MKERGSVGAVLDEMAHLLANTGDRSWSSALRALADEYTRDPAEVARRIRGLYAGMGSVNDIVLYAADGRIPVETNERFDALRSELFALCSIAREP